MQPPAKETRHQLNISRACGGIFWAVDPDSHTQVERQVENVALNVCINVKVREKFNLYNTNNTNKQALKK